MISAPKMLYSNEHVDKVFLMVKSFITFYLIQYHKNAFHDELSVSIYFISQKELYFPGLVKIHEILALGFLESVSNKKSVYLEKKSTCKKYSTRKINFHLAKFTF